MDVDTIEPGTDFASAIVREVASCDVLIALIGPTWSTITDQCVRRRLDDPDDFVALELRAALEREIRIIPVLVDGAVMPDRHDLPEGLQDLARHNAVRLNHETFRSDVAALLDTVERVLPTLAQKASEPTVRTGAHVADRAIDKERPGQASEANNVGLQLTEQGDAAGAKRVATRLIAYRIAAYATGVMLLVLTVSVVLRYGFSDDRLTWSGIVHGYLYLGYLVCTVLLGTSVRWRPARMVLIALAGTIPLMSFVAERSVTREVRAGLVNPTPFR